MRFISFAAGHAAGIGIVTNGGEWRGLRAGETSYPGDLLHLLREGPEAMRAAYATLRDAPLLDKQATRLLPPLSAPPKIICVGLNYADHAKESNFEPPAYPTLFARFASSLIGHGAPMIRPILSEQLDYEGEMVAVIGTGGHRIPHARALDHVAGYSVFNDGSVRDYQFKAPQWTVGKNFDGTGAFGPHFVTADELPPGASGLRLQTRLNGTVLQDATTADLLFDVATLIATISEAISLQAGDVIVTGTPSGVGAARTPKIWMKPGDLCEVEIEGIGLLVNPIEDEPRGT